MCSPAFSTRTQPPCLLPAYKGEARAAQQQQAPMSSSKLRKTVMPGFPYWSCSTQPSHPDG